MPYSHILGFLASVGTRTPRVWFQHGPVGGSLDRLAMMLPASLILFNTRYLQETHNRTTVPFAWPSPQNILPCGVREHAFPASEIAALRHTLLGASKTVLAVLAGRVCPAKGQDRLITALEILRNQGRDDLLRNLRVAIVGSASGEGDLRYEQTLKDKVSSLFPDVGDSAPVIFLGHRNDVPQLFAAADCALHCTVIPEAFGLAAAEALMQNCLLIGGDVGGIRDILIDEVTGLTYPATSPNASFELAVRLTRVLEDFSAGRREHYQSLASNGRNRVRQFHGLPAMAANLESAYRALQRPGVALPTSGNQGL